MRTRRAAILGYVKRQLRQSKYNRSFQNLPPKDRIQYRPGDILIGAAMQVSSKKSNGNCEEDQHGIQLVEVMNMIIDQVSFQVV